MDHPEGPHRPTGNQDHSMEEEENEVPDEPSTGWSRVNDSCCSASPMQFLHRTTSSSRGPQLLQLLGMWGYAPVSNGQTPLVGIGTPLWGLSFLEQQKGTFLSLTNHNLSLLSWCKKKPSMGQGHRVTFNMNTSVMEITKAYTSYMKIKEEKDSLTKGGQASQYLEQYYQVWGEYFWMTPEKGQLIAPATICWEQKEQKVGFGDCPLDLKELLFVP